MPLLANLATLSITGNQIPLSLPSFQNWNMLHNYSHELEYQFDPVGGFCTDLMKNKKCGLTLKEESVDVTQNSPSLPSQQQLPIMLIC